MLKVAVTQWLTQGKVSKRTLDCFRELMETIDQICLHTAESYARGYRTLLTNHKVLFCVCFTTDILSIMNELLLVLQKEGAPLVNIQCSFNLILNKFCELAGADSPDKYINILSPTRIYFATYQEYIDILTDLGETRKSLSLQGSQINIQNFHYSVATPLIELLVKEIKEAFDVKGCPCFMFSTASILEIYLHQLISRLIMA